MPKKTIKNTNMKKNFIWNTIGTSLYAFTSLFFMIIVTRINGVDDAGIFTFAFSFACMIQVIGLYAGRTYQVTEKNKKITDRDYIHFKILCCVLMFIFALGFIFARGYTPYKIIIIIILVMYKALDAYAESYYGVFQKYNNLYQCGISLTLKAIICTLVFWFCDIIFVNLTLSLIALLITDAVIFILYDLVHLRKYKVARHKFNMSSIKILLFGGLSVCVFYLLTQYIVNTQKFAIDFMLTNEDQTIFGIVLMPATFMTLCAVFVFNPFTTKINEYMNENNWLAFNELIKKICVWVLLIGFAVIVICAFIGIPILNFIYGLDLSKYYIHLMVIVGGSVFYAVFTILTNALISLRKNTVQLIIFIIGAIFSSIVSVILIGSLDLLGASISYFTTMLFMLILYIITYNIEMAKIKNGK